MNEPMMLTRDCKRARKIVYHVSRCLPTERAIAHRRIRRASKRWVRFGDFDGSSPYVKQMTGWDIA